MGIAQIPARFSTSQCQDAERVSIGKNPIFWLYETNCIRLPQFP